MYAYTTLLISKPEHEHGKFFIAIDSRERGNQIGKRPSKDLFFCSFSHSKRDSKNNNEKKIVNKKT